MKILILQLARLGDIYSTYPVLNAIRRNHPTAQIDLLVRKKFAAATDLLTSVSNIKILDTADILSDVVYGNVNDCANSKVFTQCSTKMNSFLSSLKNEKYDRIINLSFSPLSSYLTYYISSTNTEVRGYTRHTDGFLSLPDDASAYFYAQVGISKFNRFHIVDLMAEVANEIIQDEDWTNIKKVEMPTEALSLQNQKYIVVHCGASTQNKQYPAAKWNHLLRKMIAKYEMPICLIGSDTEKDLVQRSIVGLESGKIHNFCGKFNLNQSLALIQKAEFLIGADSAPIHMASLVGTPVLNLSCRAVNFWETGPRSPDSIILYSDNIDAITSDSIIEACDYYIHNKALQKNFIHIQNYTGEKTIQVDTNYDFEWLLLQALYQGQALPVSEQVIFYDALSQVSELNEIAIVQLQNCVENKNYNADIISRVDELIFTIAMQVPSIQVMTSWLKTEKIRCGPDSLQATANKYLNIHLNMDALLNTYLGDNQQDEVTA